jgi:hypothetical protein
MRSELFLFPSLLSMWWGYRNLSVFSTFNDVNKCNSIKKQAIEQCVLYICSINQIGIPNWMCHVDVISINFGKSETFKINIRSYLLFSFYSLTLTKRCHVENENIITQSNKQRTRDQQVIVNPLTTTQLQVRQSSIKILN